MLQSIPIFLSLVPSISVVAPPTQIVGQSLLLECDVVSVKGITSNIDIVWSSDGIVLQTDEGVSLTVRTSTTTNLTSTYLISLLSTSDEDRTYQCEMIINATQPVITADNVTLDVTGVYICLNHYVLIIYKVHIQLSGSFCLITAMLL